MRLLYSIVGLLSGLAIGVVAGGMIFGMLLGVSWIFIFGDNPWPSYVIPVIVSIFLLVIFISALIGLVKGYKHGCELVKSGADIRKELIRAVLILIVCCMPLAFFALRGM